MQRFIERHLELEKQRNKLEQAEIRKNDSAAKIAMRVAGWSEIEVQAIEEAREMLRQKRAKNPILQIEKDHKRQLDYENK